MQTSAVQSERVAGGEWLADVLPLDLAHSHSAAADAEREKREIKAGETNESVETGNNDERSRKSEREKE